MTATTALRRSPIAPPATAGSLADAQNLGLIDLTVEPRAGYKGSGTANWLAAQGLRFEEAPNRTYRQADGTLAARLSWGEFLLLPSLFGSTELIDRLAAAWSFEQAPMCFPVPRQDSHAWFAVTGRQAPAMFAKLCAVDLSTAAFADLAVAQTSVARLSAVIIRADSNELPCYFLLADSASARYLWDVLLDAMDEFQGRPLGSRILGPTQGSPADG